MQSNNSSCKKEITNQAERPLQIKCFHEQQTRLSASQIPSPHFICISHKQTPRAYRLCMRHSSSTFQIETLARKDRNSRHNGRQRRKCKHVIRENNQEVLFQSAGLFTYLRYAFLSVFISRRSFYQAY